MELHITPPLAVLSCRRRLRLPEIGLHAPRVYADLHARARSRGFAADGPPVFVARDMPTDAQTLFDMDFCLPVKGGDLPLLPPLRCARAIHEGPLAGLFVRGYQPLLQAIALAGLRMSGESREVYHAWHGPESPDNRIEIQIGLAA